MPGELRVIIRLLLEFCPKAAMAFITNLRLFFYLGKPFLAPAQARLHGKQLRLIARLFLDRNRLIAENGRVQLLDPCHWKPLGYESKQ